MFVLEAECKELTAPFKKKTIKSYLQDPHFHIVYLQDPHYHIVREWGSDKTLPDKRKKKKNSLQCL